MLLKEMQQQSNEREGNRLGNRIVLRNLGLKESNSLGVRVVLGMVYSLSIHYVRIRCIFVRGKQERTNLFSPKS